MDTSNLRCCPPDWYAACSNAPLSCKNCLAGMGSNLSLLRFSLNKNLNLNKIAAARFNKKNHPVHDLIKNEKEPAPEINKTLASQVREGYKAERKLANKINKSLNKTLIKLSSSHLISAYSSLIKIDSSLIKANKYLISFSYS